jgi:hypothetical protein
LTDENQICKNFVIFQKFSQFYYVVITVVSLVDNSCFYAFIEPLVADIGYPLRTDENRLLALAVFMCLWVDMFILPLFIGMNLLEHAENTLSNTVFKGRYTVLNAS